MRKNLFRLLCLVLLLLSFPAFQLSAAAELYPEDTQTEKNLEIVGSNFNSPPDPPPEYEEERQASIKPLPNRGSEVLLGFPSYDWVFGCHAVAAAMIAGYYDQGSYTNMYDGPTNGGVMPLTDTSWGTWSDSVRTYPDNPLVASHFLSDGRVFLGTIDMYWVSYGSSADDPYITNGWTEHTWGSAIGDFMKTSQSAYFNKDMYTHYYYNPDGTKFTCAAMESAYHSSHEMYYSDLDGTYGRKEFYEARGYTVTECYNQLADTVGGGFTLADFQAEIDDGHPVLLRLYKEGGGHAVVGYAYEDSTIWIRDTWDSDPAHTYTMQWDGGYPDEDEGPYFLSGVGVVKLDPDEAGDSYEPDDSSGQANWINDGDTQNHTIGPIGDDDWVKFYLDSDSSITLETSGPSGDTWMVLYDSGLTEIDHDDDSGPGYFSYIDRVCGDDPLPSGNYYVKVSEYLGWRQIPTYDITFNVSPCEEGDGDTFEPDDSSGEANWILDGSPHAHSIVPVGDEDWVKFDLSSQSQVVLETDGPSGDTEMWLYDGGLTQIDYDDDSGPGNFSLIDRLYGDDPLPAGTYYVKVAEYDNNDEITAYTITLNIYPRGEDQYNIFLPLIMIN